MAIAGRSLFEVESRTSHVTGRPTVTGIFYGSCGMMQIKMMIKLA